MSAFNSGDIAYFLSEEDEYCGEPDHVWVISEYRAVAMCVGGHFYITWEQDDYSAADLYFWDETEARAALVELSAKAAQENEGGES